MPYDYIPSPNACIVDNNTLWLFLRPSEIRLPSYHSLNLEIYDTANNTWITVYEGVTIEDVDPIDIDWPILIGPGIKGRYVGNKWLYIMEEAYPGNCLRIYVEPEVLNRLVEGVPLNGGYLIPDTLTLFPPRGEYTVRIPDTATAEY